jgi:hypothetical protein
MAKVQEAESVHGPVCRMMMKPQDAVWSQSLEG